LNGISPLLDLESDIYHVQSGESGLSPEEQRQEALWVIEQLKQMYSISKRMVKCICEI